MKRSLNVRKRKVNEMKYNHCGNIPMETSGYEWDTTTKGCAWSCQWYC